MGGGRGVSKGREVREPSNNGNNFKLRLGEPSHHFRRRVWFSLDNPRVSTFQINRGAVRAVLGKRKSPKKTQYHEGAARKRPGKVGALSLRLHASFSCEHPRWPAAEPKGEERTQLGNRVRGEKL
jgi:hypothetical protein